MGLIKLDHKVIKQQIVKYKLRFENFNNETIFNIHSVSVDREIDGMCIVNY